MRTTTPQQERVIWITALLSALIVACGLVLGCGVASAASTSSLNLTVAGSSTPLLHGGSDTPYGVALPTGAACPGDTEHDGQHVFSYLVPSTIDPESLNFRTGLPSAGYGFITHGEYYGAINTAPNSGTVVEIPPSFTWTRLTTQDLFPHGQTLSTWNAGLACANDHGAVTALWNTDVTFHASASDPKGFTFQTEDHVLPSAGTAIPFSVWCILVAALLAVAAIVIDRRHRQRKPASELTDAGDPATSDLGHTPVGAGRR